jgi:hypothetical protein
MAPLRPRHPLIFKLTELLDWIAKPIPMSFALPLGRLGSWQLTTGT